MFGDGSLTMREFAMKEPLPLATIHDAVLDFLRNRDDAVLVGTHAVNAYVDQPRITQQVLVQSARADALSSALRDDLALRFQEEFRTRQAKVLGDQFFLLSRPESRAFANIAQTSALPPNQRVAGVKVALPEILAAEMVQSIAALKGHPGGNLLLRDLKVLLLGQPQLKTESGPVMNSLVSSGATPEVIFEWSKLVQSTIVPEDDEDGY